MVLFLVAAAASPVSGEDLKFTLPAVASLHGVPPAFFHSDVWIFNGSAQHEVAITATYRCASGSCGNAVQTFTIPSRQVRFFPDVVATLFGAPETSGAIEFESADPIVVTSRLYTPERTEPTLGMFVPGLKPEDAHASSVLTSLAHSVNFRTNVGVYNGNDVALPVLFSFYEASGALLGHVFETVGPRRPLQLNDGDVFARLGVLREIHDFYCVVTGDGARPLFAYASVIDNRSQDPTFVRGEDAAGLPVAKITLPAAASLRGVGGTFFHSDLHLWNASPTTPATVIARYLCFTGACGDAEQSVVVAPRQMLDIEDVVTGLFRAPGTGGAIEFVSEQPIVVSSRLYTPEVSAPTVGMFVPGLIPQRATPAIVLNGLSHPSDSATGSRVNVGVFNQADVPQVVTYRIFDGSGNRLGQTARFFGAREVFQVNDVFAFLDVEEPVENAYLLLEGSELLPLFGYAAVIDNRSQDPIFIPGEDDPEKPPIVPLRP